MADTTVGGRGRPADTRPGVGGRCRTRRSALPATVAGVIELDGADAAPVRPVGGGHGEGVGGAVGQPGHGAGGAVVVQVWWPWPRRRCRRDRVAGDGRSAVGTGAVQETTEALARGGGHTGRAPRHGGRDGRWTGTRPLRCRAVGGGHREGVAGAVGQPGHREGGGRGEVGGRGHAGRRR